MGTSERPASLIVRDIVDVADARVKSCQEMPRIDRIEPAQSGSGSAESRTARRNETIDRFSRKQWYVHQNGECHDNDTNLRRSSAAGSELATGAFMLHLCAGLTSLLIPGLGSRLGLSHDSRRK